MDPEGVGGRVAASACAVHCVRTHPPSPEQGVCSQGKGDSHSESKEGLTVSERKRSILCCMKGSRRIVFIDGRSLGLCLRHVSTRLRRALL